MALRRMQISNFRCMQSAEIDFDPNYTLIQGPNASGKTSLLEAIYVLGRGRSFRTRRLHNLIRSAADRFMVVGDVEVSERLTGIGVEGSVLGIRAKMGGEWVSSLAHLAAVLPVQIIDPEIHRLIEEGPSLRRRYLDWGVFHVEHAFVGDWQKYQQVFKQRNAALRTAQPKAVVSAWDADLLRLGARIDVARARYTEQLSTVAIPLARRLLGLELSLTYRSGWKLGMSFEAALHESWPADQDAGATLVGPQRAELSICLNGLSVKDRISRGQQKLLASALLVAQVALFPRDSQARPTLLLDDPAAELDTGRLLGLIQEVSQESVQLVVTTLNVHFDAFGSPGRRYAVEGGMLRAI